MKRWSRESRAVTRLLLAAAFVLTHHHEPADCGAAIAAWQGFESPLRGLPPFVAARTEIEAVREVLVP